MIIEKVFSNVEEPSENLYSVLMTEEELRMYAAMPSSAELAKIIAQDDGGKGFGEIIGRIQPHTHTIAGMEAEARSMMPKKPIYGKIIRKAAKIR